MEFATFMIGASFKTTSLDNLGQIQWDDPNGLEPFFDMLKARFCIEECFFLRSCNRREFYFYAPNAGAAPETIAEQFPHLLSASLGKPIDGSWLRFQRDAKAVRHLFRVAASLDSMVLGETEITRQIRDQFALAARRGHCGKQLRLLVNQALRASKRVRTETGITRNVTSMPSLIHRRTMDFLRRSANKRVVFVGAGPFMESILPAFGKEENLQLHFVNRTPTSKLADLYEGTHQDLESFLKAPGPFDALISATGSPTVLFQKEWVAACLQQRNLMLVDTALPCDIDPRCAELPGIRHLGLKEMETVLADNRARRTAEIPRCEPIFSEVLQDTVERFRELALGNLHARISAHYKETGEKALDYLFQKELENLGDEEREVLLQWTKGLVSRLVNIPILGLKGVARDLGEEGVAAWVREVDAGSSLFDQQIA